MISFQPKLINLTPIKQLGKFVKHLSLNKIGFKNTELWLNPGEQAASKRFAAFLKKIDMYDKHRDLPEVDGTSGLSVHLRFGTISIRSLVRAAYKRKTKGAQLWLSELIWRDFYHMILDLNPIVIEETFLPQFKELKWSGTNSHFIAWKKGITGYPIIDAAMRHFNKTGWMHNRLRMIVASFLVKDLLVDWRKGEAYFSRYLLDFDLAANNGGWQWSSSKKRDYYNYLVYANHLIAVDDSTNQSKSDRSPDQWKPPNSNYHCTYAKDWINIKNQWSLTVTTAEWSSLQSMLNTCGQTFIYTPPIAQ